MSMCAKSRLDQSNVKYFYENSTFSICLYYACPYPKLKYNIDKPNVNTYCIFQCSRLECFQSRGCRAADSSLVMGRVGREASTNSLWIGSVFYWQVVALRTWLEYTKYESLLKIADSMKWLHLSFAERWTSFSSFDLDIESQGQIWSPYTIFYQCPIHSKALSAILSKL